MLRVFSPPLAVVLSAQAMFATPALAACGDWLAHPDSSNAAVELSSALTMTDSDDRDEMPFPGPCRGLRCRQVPNQPVPSAPLPVIKIGKEVYGEANVIGNPSSRSTAAAEADQACPRCGFMPRIERPPRF